MADENKLDQMMEQALADPGVPKIYFNSVINALSNSDVTILLHRNNRPVAVLNASYTVAKTLAAQLTNVIAELEKATNHEIMTSEAAAEFLEKVKNATPETPSP